MRLGSKAGRGWGVEALGSVFQLIAFLLALSFITSQSGLHGMGGFPSLALSWSVLGVRQGLCQLAQLLNSQNPYFKVITDQKKQT